MSGYLNGIPKINRQRPLIVWAPAFFPFFSHFQNGWPENVECTCRPPLKKPLLWNNHSNYLAKKKKLLGRIRAKTRTKWGVESYTYCVACTVGNGYVNRPASPAAPNRPM